MHAPAASTIFGLGAGTAILLAALLVLYVWFCVYWWRGGRPVAGREQAESAEPRRERRERPRRRAA